MQHWIENFSIIFLKNLEIFFSEIFCSHFRINDTWWFECETEKNVEKRKIVLRERESVSVGVCGRVCVGECVWERASERARVCVFVCVREWEGYCSFFRSHELAIKSWNYLRPETTGHPVDSNIIQGTADWKRSDNCRMKNMTGNQEEQSVQKIILTSRSTPTSTTLHS